LLPQEVVDGIHSAAPIPPGGLFCPSGKRAGKHVS
jgi:hypothetical protein